MASYTERLELSLEDIVEDGLEQSKFPAATSLRWLLGLLMLDRDPAPAAAAFREQRDRFADTDDAWKGMIEGASCAAGNLLLGEPPADFARRGLAHFAKIEPGFYTSADVLELALGLAISAGDYDAAAHYRQERLLDPPDMSSAEASFERLYLTSGQSDDAPADAIGWSVFRATWRIAMVSIATYLTAPTICVLPRFSDRKLDPAALFKGRVTELDRRHHIEGNRYGPRVTCTLAGAELTDGPSGKMTVLRFDIKGKGRYDAAFEGCPPLAWDFLSTVEAAKKLLRGKQRTAFKTGLEEAGLRVSAALHFAKGTSAQPGDLDLLTRRLAVAVEHAQRYKSWRLEAGVVSAV